MKSNTSRCDHCIAPELDVQDHECYGKRLIALDEPQTTITQKLLYRLCVTIVRSENVHTNSLKTPKYYVEVTFGTNSTIEHIERTSIYRSHNAVIGRTWCFRTKDPENEFVIIKIIDRDLLIGSTKHQISTITFSEREERIPLVMAASGTLVVHISLIKQ